MIRRLIYVLIPFMLMTSNAMASQSVTLPFNNVTISEGGLTFDYNTLVSNDNRKIVCHLHDVYKAWLEFSENGVASQSNVFGGHQIVVLSATERTHQRGESVSVYQVDKTGRVKIMDVRGLGVASCHYESESK